MAISSKKINILIETVFCDEAYSENRDLLIKVAKNIYAKEVAMDTESDQNKKDQIRSIISNNADEYRIIQD